MEKVMEIVIRTLIEAMEDEEGKKWACEGEHSGVAYGFVSRIADEFGKKAVDYILDTIPKIIAFRRKNWSVVVFLLLNDVVAKFATEQHVEKLAKLSTLKEICFHQDQSKYSVIMETLKRIEAGKSFEEWENEE